MLLSQNVKQRRLSRDSKKKCLWLRMMPFVTAAIEGLLEEASQVGAVARGLGVWTEKGAGSRGARPHSHLDMETGRARRRDERREGAKRPG